MSETRPDLMSAIGAAVQSNTDKAAARKAEVDAGHDLTGTLAATADLYREHPHLLASATPQQRRMIADYELHRLAVEKAAEVAA